MKAKIKVVFFAEILVEEFDGASRTIFQIINSIPDDKFEFLFVCGVKPGVHFVYEVFDVPAITIPFNKNYKMAIPFFNKSKLYSKLNEFAPDVIHISTPSLLGKLGLDFAYDNEIPVISIYHTHFLSYVDYYMENFKMFVDPVKQLMINGLKKFYFKCSLVYIPTSVITKELVSLGFVDSNMKIWPRGLDSIKFNPIKRDTSHIYKRTGNQNPNILFASRLVWEKNLKTLIQIYTFIQKRNLKYNIIIAGDGVATDDLKIAMPNAIFLGQLSHTELAVTYASCDVFLFTSVTESYGNVVSEAMASGLPVVIANGGGSAGLVEDGINGLLCEAFNAHDYIRNIDKLIKDQNLRSTIIHNGLELTKKLKWSALTDIYFRDLEILASSVNNQEIAV